MKKQDLSIANLPDHCGVYFFHNKEGEILYVGKATSLRDRVRSYFSSDLIKTRGLHLVTMVTVANKVTYQKTDSILEAILLESNLIKKYNPPYNSKEKDNKSFTCVVITKEDYPRVLPMRIRDFEKKFNKKEVLAVYGPFISLKQLRDILKIVRKLFPYRDTCLPAQAGEPSTRKDLVQKKCFNAQIGLCPGVCVGFISKEDYKKNISNIRKLFSGKKNDIKKSLEKEMKDCVKKEEFEKAAQIRNRLFAIDHINDVNLISDEEIVAFKDLSAQAGRDFRIEAYDVAHISGTSRVGVMVVTLGGEKETGEYRKFKLTEKVNDDYEGLREILRRRLAHANWQLPDLFVFDGGVGQKQAGEKVLAEAGIMIPCASVVKDERHKPKDILGDKVLVENYKKAILLANHEAHRFAISYHKQLRNKLN